MLDIQEICGTLIDRYFTLYKKVLCKEMAYSVVRYAVDDSNVQKRNTDTSEYNADQVIEKCMNIIQQPFSAKFQTLKMQVFFKSDYSSTDEILIEHHKLKSSKLHLILESINKYKCLQCSNEIEEFKKYIIAYIHVKSGLENSLDLCYEPEITFATFSVFPSSKFTEFCSLDLQEKAMALNELADIVTGIILFNKEFEHEQEFGNLKSVLHDALLIMSKKVDDKMLSAQNDLEKYIEIYRKCLQLQQEGDLPEDISLYVLEDFVLNTIQYKYFVHQLGNDVSLCARRVQDKIEYFNLHIENFIKSDQLSEDNGPRSSSFIQLAQIWDVLKEEVIVLSQCIFVLCNLQLYKQAPENVFSEEKFDKFLQNENALYKINSDKPVIKEILQSNSLKLIQTESVGNNLTVIDGIAQIYSSSKITPHANVDWDSPSHESAIKQTCQRNNGTQTHLSNFRKENASQVYLHRCQGTQTCRDNSTDTLKYGLNISGIYKPFIHQ